MRLLEADEICEPFNLPPDSRVILGNFIAFCLEKQLGRPDADKRGDLLLELLGRP